MSRPAGDAAGAEAPRPRVGVLALQGDVARHEAALEALGVEAVRVVTAPDLEGLAALVLPGGESTTMLTLVESGELREPLTRFLSAKPALGTCAGAILLGREAGGLPSPAFEILDVAIERNAYGRQIDSFHAELDVPAVGGRFPGVFIRAPRMRDIGPGVEVIARLSNGGDGAGEPVGVRSGHTVALCFHPELTADLRFYRWFLTEVAGLRLPAPETVTADGETPRSRGAA